jgi:hypothetical protein
MSKRSLRVLQRFLAQSAIPFALAAAYAWWNYMSTPAASRSVSAIVNTLSVAFFLIMWAVGQWLRTDKQLQDAERFAEIGSDIGQIKSGLGLISLYELPETTVLIDARGKALALIEEAKEAYECDFVRYPLLLMAEAFEVAIRALGLRLEVPGATSMPGINLLAELREALGPDIANDFMRLWKARSVVIDGDNNSLDADSFLHLFVGYRQAVEILLEKAAPA